MDVADSKPSHDASDVGEPTNPLEKNLSKRQEALRLAEAVVDDVELRRSSAPDTAMKTWRLARLLDDTDAMPWLDFEINGYPPGPLSAAASEAARRSNRLAEIGVQDGAKYWTASLGSIAATIEVASGQLAAAGATPPATGELALLVERTRQAERASLVETVRSQRQLSDRIVGALHRYATQRHQELRFGAAAESAFEVVRRDVDSRIGARLPGALPSVAAAYENASSSNPEHWANAASTCRRLLRLAADQLQPAGPDIEQSGRTIKMGDGNYVNRLAVWVEERLESSTQAALVTAELEHLGHRLDAIDAAGQKGAHATVSRYEASRFIAATYLLLGDFLSLAGTEEAHDRRQQPT